MLNRLFAFNPMSVYILPNGHRLLENMPKPPLNPPRGKLIRKFKMPLFISKPIIQYA